MNKIHPYRKSFLESCLNLFRSNMPKYFAPNEENLLCKYLMKSDINYYLLLNREENLVAAGGYEYEKESHTVSLTWGMVHHKLHNIGYGTYMMEHRLQKIKKEFPEINIALNTSQYTFKFYEKFGFSVTKITKDGYYQGLDKYDMIKTSIGEDVKRSLLD